MKNLLNFPTKLRGYSNGHYNFSSGDSCILADWMARRQRIAKAQANGKRLEEENDPIDTEEWVAVPIEIIKETLKKLETHHECGNTKKN